jgi:ribosome assembly protein SQT1
MHVLTGHSDSVTCGRFTPDGKSIVTGSADSTIIVWDPRTGSAIVRFDVSDSRFHQAGVTSLDVSNDSSLIVSGGTDGSVNVLHATSGKFVSSLGHHTEGLSIESIKFSNAMGFVATSGVDGVVNVWELSTMKIRFSLKHDDAVTKVCWADSNMMLVSSSVDGTVRVWDGRTGENVHVHQGHQSSIHDFAINADASRVVSCSEDGTCLVF